MMICYDCKYFDKDYDKLNLSFPHKRCNKNVITRKINNKYFSINDKCDFKKVIT